MRRSRQDEAPKGHAMLSEANADRLANALCRMRGAALKLGAPDTHAITGKWDAATMSAVLKAHGIGSCRLS